MDYRTPFGAIGQLGKTGPFSRAKSDLDLPSQRIFDVGVRNGALHTPHMHSCLNAFVVELCRTMPQSLLGARCK
jgi:hypothetical protein